MSLVGSGQELGGGTREGVRQGAQVQSLVKELRSHMPLGQTTNPRSNSSIVINSIKTLKMVHIKKLFQKNLSN